MTTRNKANRIVPSLAYADAPKAIEFLSKAFGFRETYRYPMEDGRIGYAELVYQDSVLSLASVFEGFGETPLKLPATSCTLRVYVDDVDAHYKRALEGGATITAEISEDHGLRLYRASDPEGHRWVFATELPE